MSSLKGKTTNRNLLKKGFTEANGDHKYFEFWHNNVMIAKTKTSHNDQDIYDGLISAMSKQCKVGKEFFKSFATCKKSKEEYIKELQNLDIIPKDNADTIT